MRKLLARLFETSTAPEGKVAAMRKLALAPEPVCKPPEGYRTQPVEKPVAELERWGKL